MVKVRRRLLHRRRREARCLLDPEQLGKLRLRNSPSTQTEMETSSMKKKKGLAVRQPAASPIEIDLTC
jgi:hypothetical protein